MNKNTQVETAQKSQATNKIKKSKTPTGKVTLIKETEARKKAREEQYRNFRINALRRRCKRMKFSEEQIEELVKKLIEQLNAPKEYDILIMFNPKEASMLKEALANANIQYRLFADGYCSIGGNQNVLAKIREIAPPSAKIHPYAKKMESVIPKQEPSSEKKHTNNTAEVKKAAKANRKTINKKRGMHKKGKGKSLAKCRRKETLAKRKKARKATTIQLKGKKGSEGSKTLKKAA